MEDNAIVVLKRKLARLPSMMPRLLMEVFNEIASVVEDLNIEQLAEGKDGNGEFLPDYSPVSVYVYGKRPGPMNLHDEGGFWMGITMTADEEGFELTSSDYKTDMLQLRYGEAILKLTEESIEKLKIDYVIQMLQEKIHNYLTE